MLFFLCVNTAKIIQKVVEYLLYGNILIVSQDKYKSSRFKNILQTNGFHVANIAEDASKAIRTLRTKDILLTIIDNSNKNIGSMRLAKIIDEENLGPIVLVDLPNMDDLKFAPESIMGILNKPISQDQLMTTVNLAIFQYNKNIKLRNELDSLKVKLEDRKLIDKAKGILMKARNLNEDSAYRIIREQSMNKRVAMKVVAKQIIGKEEINT